VEQERLRKMREDLLTRELAISSQEGSLEHCTTELAAREKQLAEREVQELTATCKVVEEVQATHAAEAQKVWDFLGHTETALVPLVFSPIRSGGPAQEMSQVLPALDSAGARILTLEEVSTISWRSRVESWQRRWQSTC
jgi:hypothetical protein